LPTKKVKHTQPLFGEASALGYLIMVPGASALIRQNGVACSVYSNATGTAMTNPVPTGVPTGTAGVDVNGTLLVFLDPGSGYDAQVTVGAAVSTLTIPDIHVDVDDITSATTTRQANQQAGNYTLVLADAGKAVEGNSASALSFTVPPNSSVAYPVGTIIEVPQVGAGAVTLVAGSGVTITGDTVTPGQGGSLLLRKTGTNTWWSSIASVRSGTYVAVPSSTVTHEVFVTATGSDSNNGLTWASAKATIAAAVAALPSAVGRVHLGVGQFTLTSTLNATNKVGIEFWGRGLDYTTVILATGGIGIDCTGSMHVRFKDLSLDTFGSGTPSTVGVLLARSSVNNFVEFAEFDSVKVFVASDTEANGGNGSVGIYNNAAEISLTNHCQFFADNPYVLTGNNAFSITSALATHYAGATSMSTCTSLATVFHSLLNAPVLLEAAWDNEFLNCYWVKSAGTPQHAVEVRGDTRRLKMTGLCESLPRVLYAVTDIGSLTVEVTHAFTVGQPAIYLDGDTGPNSGIRGGNINVHPGSGVGGAVIKTSASGQAGVRDCLIYLHSGQTLDAAGGRTTGLLILAEDANPTITVSVGAGFRSYTLIAQDRVVFSSGEYVVSSALNTFDGPATFPSGYVSYGKDMRRSQQSPAFETPYTPDPTSGENIVITLTDNVVVNAPSNGAVGQKMMFIWVQDATGGRTITYNTAFKTGGGAPLVTTANTITLDTFYTNDGNNWRLVSRVTGQ
jgi:hypothetical protein